MAALEESLAKMKGERQSGDHERLATLSKKQLQDKAADAGVEGRSKMSKNELVEALDS